MAKRRSTRRRPRKWIQRALGDKHTRSRRRGALHRRLRVPKNRKIPMSLLIWAAKQPGKLGHQAHFAIVARKFKKQKSHKRRRA